MMPDRLSILYAAWEVHINSAAIITTCLNNVDCSLLLVALATVIDYTEECEIPACPSYDQTTWMLLLGSYCCSTDAYRVPRERSISSKGDHL